MIAHYQFPDIESADACSQQLYRLGRPYKHFQQDIGVRVFGSIEAPDGSGLLMLDLDREIVVHKDGINYDREKTLTTGTVGTLLRNFAGQPAPEETAGWFQLVDILEGMPDRGSPALEGQEPVIRVRLGDMMPASALANLLTQEQVDALFPQPEAPE